VHASQHLRLLQSYFSSVNLVKFIYENTRVSNILTFAMYFKFILSNGQTDRHGKANTHGFYTFSPNVQLTELLIVVLTDLRTPVEFRAFFIFSGKFINTHIYAIYPSSWKSFENVLYSFFTFSGRLKPKLCNVRLQSLRYGCVECKWFNACL
jgi:hypothetical protein